MLKYRLITAFILILTVIGILFLFSLIEFILVIFLLCMLSTWEWGQLVKINSYTSRVCFVVFCNLLLMLIIALTIPIHQPLIIILQKRYIIYPTLLWWLTALLLVIYYPKSTIVWRKSQILRSLFGILIILPFFWSILILRQHNYDSNHFIGSWWLLYVISIVCSADSGAYIIGRMLGRHKLAPKISPSKTWEGLVGGLVTSIILTLLILNKYVFLLEVIPYKFVICSVITIISSILGDLTESMFKREAGVKDSGCLIPGHGGILDRIDSLTAALPIFTCLMLLFFNIF